MINVGPFQKCQCMNIGNPHDLCDGPLKFEEKGKKVSLIPKGDEDAIALVIDGCICKDNNPKCDGLFIFEKKNRRWMILVELKGSHPSDAVRQLAYTKKARQEYAQIRDLIRQDKYQVLERAFIISNYIIGQAELKKLEISHGIMVSAIVHSEATKPIPDLREYIL